MKSTVILVALTLGLADSITAAQVIQPDNGSGTVSMPLAASYAGTNPMNIIDGLPVGSTIQITATIPTQLLGYEEVGGSLGGTRAGYGGNTFQWFLQGTGAYSGYSRNLTFPLLPGSSVLSFTPTPSTYFNPTGATIEVHAAPRTLNAPVQTFNTDLFRGFNQITSDPDFDLLRVVMGTDFGLPSPGQTILTDIGGGNWNVESYFNITYRIDFVGRPGGAFSGLSGSTTGVAHFELGEAVPEPATVWLGLLGGLFAFRRRR